MKVCHWVFGGICAVAIIFVLLVTSVEMTLYWNRDYFRKEYQKYDIPSAVHMELDDLLYVTDEMMDYLKDYRENLVIETTINGETREFFNQREKDHMKDVKALFLDAIWIRRGCILCFLFFGGILWKRKKLSVLYRSFQIASGVFFFTAIGLAFWISRDFFQAFQRFHHVFFRNQLWILNPKTDLLINIVPQPFFVDTALRIGILFAVGVIGIWCICTFLLQREKKTGV